MIDRIFAKIGLADTHADLLRNIVSLRRSEDLFDDLSPDPMHWDAAIRLELASKPPMLTANQPVINRPFEEAAWNDAIAYPFKHWMRSRYSKGNFGIWYGADSIETSVHETVYHWRHGLLADAGFTQPGIKIERKIYQVRCDAALVDLRPAAAKFPALTHPGDYSLCQDIGAKLQHEGHPGLLSRSARCSGAIYAILRPSLLSAPRELCRLSYTSTASGVTVAREPGQVWLEI